jgi:hypothetical protein
MRTALRRMTALAGLVLVMTATATAFAADAVPTVEVSGYVDGEGQPVEVESAMLEEFETPDSEPIVTPIDVAEDGTFTVSLREWGSPEQPARARITAFAPPETTEDEDGCVESIQLFGVYEIDIAGEVPTDPIVIVYNQAARSVLCPPVTATPDPEPDEDVQAPAVTLPPTDARAATPALAASVAAALVFAGIALLGTGFAIARRGNRPS